MNLLRAFSIFRAEHQRSAQRHRNPPNLTGGRGLGERVLAHGKNVTSSRRESSLWCTSRAERAGLAARDAATNQSEEIL
jgi:hypothetical protein